MQSDHIACCKKPCSSHGWHYLTIALGFTMYCLDTTKEDVITVNIFLLADQTLAKTKVNTRSVYSNKLRSFRCAIPNIGKFLIETLRGGISSFCVRDYQTQKEGLQTHYKCRFRWLTTIFYV